MMTDLRMWPVGRLVGGDLQRVQTCPRCKLPGSQQKSKPSVFVHTFEITNAGGVGGPRLEVLDRCVLTYQASQGLSHARRWNGKAT